MRKMTLVKKMLWLLVLPLFFLACEDKMDEHYEVPKDVKNAWEILQERGNYTIFLKGVELAGFEPMVNGKNILTVMAPNDEAFAAYLREKGKNSIEELTEDELVKLIGFHLLYYSYNKEKLINYRPSEGDNATDEDKEWLAGMFYKHRTKSADPKSLERDTSGNYVYVYHQERYLPVFSYKYFQSKQIDAATNYSYFYPESQWTGETGFNVSNASVKEYELPCTNGYVYLVDRVLEPLETIYKKLLLNKEYSTFLELYNQYQYYYKDDDLTNEYGDGYDLYLHYHSSPLPNIACEWSMSDYTNVLNLSYTSYSIFAPSNAALNDIFTNFWSKGGYTSLQNVNRVAMQSLLYNCVYTGPVVFPEEIKNGKIENNYGIPIKFDPESVPQANRLMCCNGALYAMSDISYPAMFTAVTGPAYQYKIYTSWLLMIQGANMLAPLVSDNASFTMLIPSNEQLENADIIQQDDQLMTSAGGDLSAMPSAERVEYINAHLSTEKKELAKSGLQVIHTNTAYSYWYLKDNQIMSSTTLNSVIEQDQNYNRLFSRFTEVTNSGKPWSNGKVYAYDAAAAFSPLSIYENKIQQQLVVTNNTSKAYGEFANLLKVAGLKNTEKGLLTFLPKAERCLIFIPTNESIRQAVADHRIPGLGTDGTTLEDSTRLANYLMSYFVPTSSNGISDYVYPGWGQDGTYSTLASDVLQVDHTGEAHIRLRIIDGGAAGLKVQRITNEGEEAEVQVDMQYDGFPFTYTDGGVQFLKDVL